MFSRIPSGLLIALRVALVAALVGAAGVLVVTARHGVETDLYGLVDPSRKEVLSALAQSIGGQARILVEADSSSAASAAARAFAAAHPEGLAAGGDFAAAVSELAAHRAGLLAPATRALLLATNYDAVARAAYRELATGFTTPLVSVRDDPFLLTTGYLMSFQSRETAGWTLRDGLPSLERGDRAYVLLTYDLGSLPPARLVPVVHELIAAAKGNSGLSDALTNVREGLRVGPAVPSGPLVTASSSSGGAVAEPRANRSFVPRFYCSGAPFHTVLATESSKREINLLSTVSLVLVFALGFVLFRGVRFLPPLLFALAAAFLAATAAVFAVFGRPHLLTFVFGTSLIGLSVDYSYHYCVALREVGAAAREGTECGMQNTGSRMFFALRRIFRSLAFSLLTTVACFVPLLFSGVSVLRQMALFTIVGLVTVFAVVTLLYPLFGPRLGGSQGRANGPTRAAAPGGAFAEPRINRGFLFSFCLFVLALVCGLGIFRLRLGNDLTKFYKPDPFMAAGEKKFVELNRIAASTFTLVKGSSLEEALQHEEDAGVPGLSSVMPSLRRQRENATLAEKLYAAKGAWLSSVTGIKMPQSNSDFTNSLPAGREEGRASGPSRAAMSGGAFAEPRTNRSFSSSSEFLSPDRVTSPLLRQLVSAAVIRTPSAVYLVSPGKCNSDLSDSLPNGRGNSSRRSVRGASDESEFLSLFDPKAAVTALFDSYARETYRLLGISLVVLVVILVALFRRRFFAYVLPIVLATVSTLGVLGWCGETINFFHVLCFFVLIGLGLDYTIFHLGNPQPGTRQAVLFSFLTSFVGLGALAFTSFAVTRSMGLTLALGLAFAYLFSRAWQRPSWPLEVLRDEYWFQQKEQSAGRFRMMFMWYVYRLLGKDVQKVLGFFVVLFVYPFAKAGRAATNDFKRVFNGYAAAHRLPPARFSTFGHLLSFAWSMMDKTDACSLRKNLPAMTVRDDDGWRAFKSLLAAKRGAFLISTHLGTIEVLPAAYASGLTPEHPVVHAFQQLGHDAVFTKVFLDHFRGGDVILHSTEEIGVETAAAMQEAIGRGELVLMAGDRLSAGSPDAKLRHDFLDRPCVWPKGVFVFAKLMESPVFFVTCVKTGWNAYEAHFEQGQAPLLDSYVSFLERETLARPDQWFQFYRFFG